MTIALLKGPGFEARYDGDMEAGRWMDLATVYKSLCPVLEEIITGLTLENQIAWEIASEIIKLKHFTNMYM